MFFLLLNMKIFLFTILIALMAYYVLYILFIIIEVKCKEVLCDPYIAPVNKDVNQSTLHPLLLYSL